MLVQDIYFNVSSALKDLGSTKRWSWDYTQGQSVASLQPILNEALRSLVYYKPEINSHISTIELNTGVAQTIPDDGFYLLNVLRNMGTDGTTPGSVITYVKKESLDVVNPNWMANVGDEIHNWTYKPEMDKKTFWVTPGPDSTVHIEISYAKLPTEITDKSDELPVDGIYSNLIYEYMMYLILTGDNDDSFFEKGTQFLSTFLKKVGSNSSES